MLCKETYTPKEFESIDLSTLLFGKYTCVSVVLFVQILTPNLKTSLKNLGRNNCFVESFLSILLAIFEEKRKQLFYEMQKSFNIWSPIA